MNKTIRRISLLLVLAMALSLLVAYPAMNAFAADTNYALGITPEVYLDADKTSAATPATGAVTTMTDGVYETAESIYYTGSTKVFYVFIDLGSVKTNISSVYLYMRTVGNRAYPASVKIALSSDGSAYTEVNAKETKDTTTTANYTYGNYQFASARSARYVRIALAASAWCTSFGEIEVRNYGLVEGGVIESSEDVTEDPTLVNNNYAYGASYTVTKNNGAATYGYTNQTDDGSWLTNGYEAAAPTSSGVNGYTVAFSGSNATYVITVDLGSAKSVSSVTLVNVPAPGTSFKDPTITIGASNDNAAFPAVSGSSVSTVDKNGGAAYDHVYTFSAVTARYIQITAVLPGFLFGLDEIVITGSGSSASTPDSSVESSGGSYTVDTQFTTNVSASYGDWDTDNDGTNDFTGIAVTISVVGIKYSYGIFGIEGYLNFDNSKLTPLWVTDAELNGTDIYNAPKPVYSWPTVQKTFMGSTVTVPNVEGMSKAYSMADGSTTNPADPEQTFTKKSSCYEYKYIMHTDEFDGYKPDSNHMGTTANNEMQLRYYFSVAAGQEGKTFTFTVPDSPSATSIADCKLTAPVYDPNSIATMSNVAGKGGTATVTIPKAVKTYTVTFVGKDGQTLKTQTVEEGKAATAPTAPTVEGYTFTGWDKAFTNVTANITVTALYEKNAASAEFFTWADGVDSTYITLDDTNGFMIFADGKNSMSNMAYAKVIALFADSNISIKTAAGANKTSGAVGTGCTITSTINGESKTYTIVVKGDLDGNGRVNSSDVTAFKKYVNEETEMPEKGSAQFVAANLKADSRLNSSDLTLLKKYHNDEIDYFE